MHSLRMLLNELPKLLVEPRRIPWSGYTYAGIPMDGRLSGMFFSSDIFFNGSDTNIIV